MILWHRLNSFYRKILIFNLVYYTIPVMAHNDKYNPRNDAAKGQDIDAATLPLGRMVAQHALKTAKCYAKHITVRRGISERRYN